MAVNLPEENNLSIFAVDRCNQTGSYDYYHINPSEFPRVTDGQLSTMASSSESTNIVLFTVLAVTGMILLMTLVICILVIAGFMSLVKKEVVYLSLVYINLLVYNGPYHSDMMSSSDCSGVN